MLYVIHTLELYTGMIVICTTPNTHLCLSSHAIAACLATFVLDSCSKSGIAKATSSPPLDKTQTFTRADVVLRKGRGGKKKVRTPDELRTFVQSFRQFYACLRAEQCQPEVTLALCNHFSVFTFFVYNFHAHMWDKIF